VQNAAPVALPAPVAETPLHAAFACPAHSTTTAASAGALAKGVLRSMFLPKRNLGAAVLTAVALCGAGGAASYHPTQAAEPAPAAPTNKVPSERKGVLAFVATEVEPGENVPAKDKIVAKCWMLAVQEKEGAVPSEERVTVVDGVKGAAYRPWRPEDGFPPGRVRVGYMTKTYRKLAAGEVVKKGQLLALVDTELAREELSNKLARIEVVDSEMRASGATKNEAHDRWQRMEQANASTRGTHSQEDICTARLTYVRYQQEELAKKASLVAAQREASTANTILRKHEIRARVAGEIKTIHHQDGEAVKNLETVLEIQPLEENK
jgi:hypothetical protein